MRQNFSENWFYLLKSDELREAIKRRDDFLKRYGDGNSRNNYYKLPKPLRFIGPLQPLGELRAEKWLDGDWYIATGINSYTKLSNIYGITLYLTLPFIFREGKPIFSIDDIEPKITDKEWDKHYLGYLSGLHYMDIKVEVFEKNKVPNANMLSVVDGTFGEALKDFVEIYNQPESTYKNLQAYIDLEKELEEIYHKYDMDKEYFLKQILDTEVGKPIKIKLNRKSPKFIVSKVVIKKRKEILRRLKL